MIETTASLLHCKAIEIVASSQRFLRKDAHIGGFPTYFAKRAIAADPSTALPGVSSAALAVSGALPHS
jgi:hypothetical protein